MINIGLTEEELKKAQQAQAGGAVLDPVAAQAEAKRQRDEASRQGFIANANAAQQAAANATTPEQQMAAVNMGADPKSMVSDASIDMAFRQQLLNLFPTLGASATGQGPTIAQTAATQAGQRNLAAALALARSRGGGAPQMGRQAQTAMAQAQQQQVQAEALGRIQEQQQAQQLLANFLVSREGGLLNFAANQQNNQAGIGRALAGGLFQGAGSAAAGPIASLFKR